MEIAATVLLMIGIVVGIGFMIIGYRKRKLNSALFGDIDGTLKQDWTRTGNIDFHVAEFESAYPQCLVLRVEEQKVTENSMGQDIVQLRWRLATLDEAKDVVVYWNSGKPDRTPERRGALLKSA